MTEKTDKHTLSNGMVILGEQMEQVGSVAFSFRLPAGTSRFGQGCCGAGSVISDWVFRGAGKRDSKELIEALDGLGLHRDSSVSSNFMSFGAALEAGNLSEAIELYSDIILAPALDSDQFEPSRQLALLGVAALDDDPRQKVMLQLQEKFYPHPFGLPAVGKSCDLERLTKEDAAAIVKEKFNLSESIFSIAGKYDFDAVCKQLEKLFDIAQAPFDSDIQAGPAGDKYTHIHHDGAQVHIALMTKTVPVTSEDYYNVRAAVSVLSGGMSSRLFTEVREKRGLCYAIGARYNSLKDYAGISCYAGTRPDTGQETADVIRSEFNKLAEDITEDEMQRAKVGLKSSLIMESESSSARAGGIGSDYYMLGRVRTLEEIKNKIEALSTGSVTKFLKENPFEDYTTVTIGPNGIKA
jgi:predicted Zn-dependent peptidase